VIDNLFSMKPEEADKIIRSFCQELPDGLKRTLISKIKINKE
jgi:hypothetical protein